jgi:hypothetical protein
MAHLNKKKKVNLRKEKKKSHKEILNALTAENKDTI